MKRPPLGGWNRVALLGAVLALLIVVFEVLPRIGDAFALMGEWRTLRSQLAEVERAPAELQALAAENERLERELRQLLVSLPHRDQLSAVLGELQRHAADTGVTLRRIEPDEPVAERTHEVLPLALEVEGPFHALGRFVDRVERSPLLMRVEAMDVSAQRGAAVEATVALEAVRLGGNAGVGRGRGHE